MCACECEFWPGGDDMQVWGGPGKVSLRPCRPPRGGRSLGLELQGGQADSGSVGGAGVWVGGWCHLTGVAEGQGQGSVQAPGWGMPEGPSHAPRSSPQWGQGSGSSAGPPSSSGNGSVPGTLGSGGTSEVTWSEPWILQVPAE